MLTATWQYLAEWKYAVGNDGNPHITDQYGRVMTGEEIIQRLQGLDGLKADPVAWLHRDHQSAYVITDRVKQIWLKVDPKHVEHYVIPLYIRREDEA